MFWHKIILFINKFYELKKLVNKYVAQSHQYVKRSEAVYHKHLGVRNFCLKAVGDRKAFKYIRHCTTKVPQRLECSVRALENKRRQKQKNSEYNKQITQNQKRVVEFWV